MTFDAGSAWRRRSDVLLLGVAAAFVLLAVLWPSDPGGHERTSLPAGQLLVADLRDHALVVVDLPSGDVRTIDLPGGPHELLRLPDGRLVASLEQAGRLAIIDVTGGTVEVVETSGLPHGLAFHQGALLVTDRTIDATRRFDATTWAETEGRTPASTPHAVVAGPDYVAVASAGDNTLRIDGRALAVSALPETVAVSPDGQRLAVAGAFGGRVQTFATDGTALIDIAVGSRPVRALFSPDGRTLAVSLSASGEVALIDEAGAVHRVATGGVPDGLAFDARGGRLFVSDMAGGDVSMVDLARGRVLWRAHLGTSAGALLFVPR